MMNPIVLNEFEKRFQTKPQAIVQTPGRVNLIGDHTDYNLGLALPIAIEQNLFNCLYCSKDGS